MANANRKPQATQAAAPTSAMAATLATIASAPVTANPAAPIRRPAIQYVNGIAAGAPPNAPVVMVAGQAWQGGLPPTNPLNRGVVGNAKPGQLVAGPVTPNLNRLVAHNAAMWAKVQAALPCTIAQAATACGSAAFVQTYCIRNKWAALAK